MYIEAGGLYWKFYVYGIIRISHRTTTLPGYLRWTALNDVDVHCILTYLYIIIIITIIFEADLILQ